MILINVAQVFSLSLSFFLFSFLLTFYLRLCFMLVSICVVRSWSLFFFLGCDRGSRKAFVTYMCSCRRNHNEFFFGYSYVSAYLKAEEDLVKILAFAMIHMHGRVIEYRYGPDIPMNPCKEYISSMSSISN